MLRVAAFLECCVADRAPGLNMSRLYPCNSLFTSRPLSKTVKFLKKLMSRKIFLISLDAAFPISGSQSAFPKTAAERVWHLQEEVGYEESACSLHRHGDVGVRHS